MRSLVGTLIVFCVLAFATLWILGSDAATIHPDQCMDSETQEQLRAAMLAGIDHAMKEHTSHMFDVWMKDPSDQPRRAQRGMHNAVSAYVRSRAAVKRWSPPSC